MKAKQGRAEEVSCCLFFHSWRFGIRDRIKATLSLPMETSDEGANERGGERAQRTKGHRRGYCYGIVEWTGERPVDSCRISRCDKNIP